MLNNEKVSKDDEEKDEEERQRGWCGVAHQKRGTDDRWKHGRQSDEVCVSCSTAGRMEGWMDGGVNERRRSIFTRPFRKATLARSLVSRGGAGGGRGLLCVCLQPLLTLQGETERQSVTHTVNTHSTLQHTQTPTRSSTHSLQRRTQHT